ncbi:hypothetical protein EYS14_17895 [Alteromonadaceae bacterium M269]|nr:hypothetical protein EYS14_17895 [Alteromonadaceae bacterium M269]
MKYKGLLLSTLLTSFFASAVETPVTKIDRVQFNADSGVFFAYKHSGWGVCNNTQFVQLRGAIEQRDRFISQVLAAHLAKADVQFIGSCTNANGYLDSNYFLIN